MKNIINFLLIFVLLLLITYTIEIEKLENKLDTMENNLNDNKIIKVAGKELYLGINHPEIIVSDVKTEWNMIKDLDNIILKKKNNTNSRYNYYYLEHLNNTVQSSIYKNGPNKLFKIEKKQNGFNIKVPTINKYLYITKNNKVELSDNKTLFQN
uniref:Uncharacterized protein n=1 Tax=viral metagenome TaxID=1070528 RepID=A0A6C0JAG9_9ZZZZ